MKCQCAWCKEEMEPVPTLEPSQNAVVQSICVKCAKKVFADVDIKLTKFLDTLSVPVIVIDAHDTVRTANKLAQAVLGKNLPAIQGSLRGTVFSCAYSMLPGGCGASGHCEACTIRQTVKDTYKTGISHDKTPAYLDKGEPGDTTKVKFLISTEKRENYVVLRIDEVEENKGSS